MNQPCPTSQCFPGAPSRERPERGRVKSTVNPAPEPRRGPDQVGARGRRRRGRSRRGHGRGIAAISWRGIDSCRGRRGRGSESGTVHDRETLDPGPVAGPHRAKRAIARSVGPGRRRGPTTATVSATPCTRTRTKSRTSGAAGGSRAPVQHCVRSRQWLGGARWSRVRYPTAEGTEHDQGTHAMRRTGHAGRPAAGDPTSSGTEAFRARPGGLRCGPTPGEGVDAPGRGQRSTPRAERD
jgi:hypothetical protein